HLTPDQVRAILVPPQLASRSLEEVPPDHTTRVAVAFAGTVLLFVALQVFGGFVLGSVVEEKTSRIAEVLLAQVEPEHLLAGKVLGIGALALAELVAVAVAVVVAGQLAGTVPLPTVGAGAAFSVVGWFILGFGFYAVLY